MTDDLCRFDENTCPTPIDTTTKNVITIFINLVKDLRTFFYVTNDYITNGMLLKIIYVSFVQSRITHIYMKKK